MVLLTRRWEADGSAVTVVGDSGVVRCGFWWHEDGRCARRNIASGQSVVPVGSVLSTLHRTVEGVGFILAGY
jgi:hypothetical protein